MNFSKLNLKFFSIAVIFFLALNFTACSKNKKTNVIPESEKNSSLILGFSQIGTESSWRARHSESIIAAAQDANIKIIFDDAQQKQSNQLKAIHSFIIYQVDVIAFVPIVEDGWDNVLREAKEAGIPVIILDRKIKTKDPNLYTAFIGEDGYAEGQKAGEFLVEKFKNSKSRYNILELYGTAGSSIAEERSRGFYDAISKDSHFSILDRKCGDFLRSRGKEIGNEILNKNKVLKIDNKLINIVFSQNDAMTLGFIDSMISNAYPFEHNITIVSIDGEQQAIDSLIEGNISCIVECNPNMGPTLMSLIKLIKNGEPYKKEILMEGKVFTENDDFSTYFPRGY